MIARAKALLWSAALAVGVGAGIEVEHFVREGRLALRAPSRETLEAALTVEPPTLPVIARRVGYELVRSAWVELNWTGYQPPEPDTGIVEAEPPGRDATPVSELLAVALIQFSGFDAERTRATVRFAPRLAGVAARTSSELVVGDRLPGEFEFALVSEITPAWMEFAFDAEEGRPPRPPERVAPAEHDVRGRASWSIASGFQPGGEGEGESTPADVWLAPRAGGLRAGRTVRRGQRFELGAEDVETFREDYAHVLTNDVRLSRHRDPRTGRPAGVKVDGVRAGSIVARHGLENGDVVLRINEEPVASPGEAVRYVRRTVGTTERWEVLIDRRGKGLTLVFDAEGELQDPGSLPQAP